MLELAANVLFQSPSLQIPTPIKASSWLTDLQAGLRLLRSGYLNRRLHNWKMTNAGQKHQIPSVEGQKGL